MAVPAQAAQALPGEANAVAVAQSPPGGPGKRRHQHGIVSAACRDDGAAIANVPPPVAQIAAASATATAAVRPRARASGRLPDAARRSIESDSGVSTMARQHDAVHEVIGIAVQPQARLLPPPRPRGIARAGAGIDAEHRRRHRRHAPS